MEKRRKTDEDWMLKGHRTDREKAKNVS